MSERKSQSIRLGVEEHKIIADEMAAGRINFSEATRRLLRRGAGLPEPVYLKAQISCADELDEFVGAAQQCWLLWTELGSTVRAQLPPNADEETKKLVNAAREGTRKLIPQALELGTVAGRLAQKMTGIGPEELEQLKQFKKWLSDLVILSKERMAKEPENEDLAGKVRAAERALTVLKGLGI